MFGVTSISEESTHLDKGLDLAPFCEFLLSHPPCHFEWVALDAGDDCVGVWPLLRSFIQLFDYDDLLPGLSPLQDNRDLIGRIVNRLYEC